MENIQNVGFKQNHLIFFVLLIKYFIHVLLLISSALIKLSSKLQKKTGDDCIFFF